MSAGSQCSCLLRRRVRGVLALQGTWGCRLEGGKLASRCLGKEGTEGGHSLCKGPALRSREQVGEGGRAVQEVQSEAPRAHWEPQTVRRVAGSEQGGA